MKKIITIMLVIAMCLFVLTPYTYSSKLNTKNYQAFGATEANLGQSIIITLYPDNPIMTVNGISQEIDPGRGTKPVIIPAWSRTVVPIRAIVEALGGTISWDGTARKVTINLKDIVIELWIDNPKARVNGNTVYIDTSNHNVKPIIINSRTMLPLRFVAESLGCDVGWDPDTRTISITVTDTNNAPELESIGDKTVNGGEKLNFTVNATDPDGDALTYSASGDLAGYFLGDTHSFNWTPEYNKAGSYTVTFTVSDGNLTDSETITVTVINTYKLIVSKSGQGAIQLDPSLEHYPENSLVNLFAESNPGWSFDHWEGDIAGNVNPTSIVIDNEKNITAVFIQDKYVLTINKTGEGNLIINPNQDTYLYGDQVELNAVPTSGWYFSNWNGSTSKSSNPLSIIVDENKTITAVFKKFQDGFQSDFPSGVAIMFGRVYELDMQLTNNMPFGVNLTKFELLDNDGNIQSSTTDSSVLNGNWIGAGETVYLKITFGVAPTEDEVKNYKVLWYCEYNGYNFIIEDFYSG